MVEINKKLKLRGSSLYLPEIDLKLHQAEEIILQERKFIAMIHTIMR